MNFSAFNPLNTIQIGIFSLFPVFLLSMFSEVNATDNISEQQWAEQIRQHIDTGQALDLPLPGGDAKESHFFSIFTPHTNKKPKGGIILLHDIGAHSDWQDVIHPLRTKLPEKGWASLSIQLPLNKPQKQDANGQKQLIESTMPRIDAAIAFLRSKSYQYIVLVAHGYGTLISLNFLQAKASASSPDGTPLVNAAIIIGTPSSGNTMPLNSAAMIEKITIPLLDLYGSRDNLSVVRSAKARKAAAHKAGNQAYRQTQTIGANHFYTGLDEELLNYVYYWLNKTLKSPR